LFVVFFFLTTLLFGFQNCALHRSEQRTLLENHGFQAVLKTDCLPYLLSSQASAIFASDYSLSLSLTEGINQKGCIISTLDNSSSGLGTVTCTFTTDTKMNFFNLDGTSKDPYQPVEALTVNSFAVESGHGVSYTRQDQTTLRSHVIAMGSRADVLEGINCGFTFLDQADFIQSKDKAESNAQKLVQIILDNLAPDQ